MNTRDVVLGRIREALIDVDRAANCDVDLPPAPLVAPVPDLLAHFADRVRDYGAEVERCIASDLATFVADALPPGSSVIVPPGLSFDVANALVDHEGRGRLGVSDLDRAQVVVTEVAVGIAETGTIVLDHGPGQGRRAITLLPDLHICVIRAEQVVPDVPDALERLNPARPSTWISGPSATSDIELQRVEGVHGPRTLHVIIVCGGTSRSLVSAK